MAQGPSPLVGYNTNVRHKGKLYHIQTEDSGVNHPHIITHLFADGGRIIASKKSGYEGHLGAEDLQQIVKKLMQEQHKAMFIELRDCVYDEDDDAPQVASKAGATDPPTLDVEALERAADARFAESAVARARSDQKRGSGRYRQTVPAQSQRPPANPQPANSASIFGGEALQGKSLDEVILSYLADAAGEGDL